MIPRKIFHDKQSHKKATIVFLVVLLVSIGYLKFQLNIIDNGHAIKQNKLIDNGHDIKQNNQNDYEEKKILIENATTSNGNGNGNVHQSEIDEHANNEYNNNENDEDDDTNDRYLPLLKSVNNLKLELNQTKSSIEPIQVVHRASSGLGHRLKWMTTMHHFTKMMNLTNGLFNIWGWECHNMKHDEDEPPVDIFHYLFGDDVLPVSPLEPDEVMYSLPLLMDTVKAIKKSPSRNPTTREEVKELKFINEGPPIYHIFNKYVLMNYISEKEIEIKLQADFDMYTRLRTLYRHNNLARDFTKKNKYENHLVLGVHIRAGNGEKGHFESTSRGIGDLDQWIISFANMLMDMVSTTEFAQFANGKKPMLFVATDTRKAIDVLKVALKDAQSTKGLDVGIPVIHFTQEYMKEGKGVSYAAHFNSSEKCYQSWSNQFMDMTLLTASDVIIAGQFSAFSQAIPLTIALGHPDPLKRKKFCEVGVYGDVMECVTNYKAWVNLRIRGKQGSAAEVIGNTTSPTQKFKPRHAMPIFNHRDEAMSTLNATISNLFL